MAWKTPRDWTAYETPTAAIMNADLRDQLNALSTHTHSGAAGDGSATTSTSMLLPGVIAPATDTVNNGAANVTTSSTTEVTVQTVTITNPSVAGRLILFATLSFVSPTVANDIFLVRLKIGTTPTTIVTTSVAFTSTNERKCVTLVGTAAIAASGTQILRSTVQRDTGTGTVTMENGRCDLTWVFIPGAGAAA